MSHATRAIITAATRMLAVGTAAVLLAGCSSSVTGQARKDPDAPPLVVLNTGNYPTAPRPPMGEAGPSGPIVEAHRMAEAVVGPWEVDPALVRGSSNGTTVWKDTKAISSALVEPIPAIAATHNFLTGFSTDRRSDTAPDDALTSLQIAVMRFPSADAATAAATEMAAATEVFVGVTAPPAPASIAGHPDALAELYTLDDGAAVLASYTPRGEFVMWTYARARDGNADTVNRLTSRTLELQKPRLDTFSPTPADQFATLPVDPDGLQAKVISPEPGTGTVNHGAWRPHGALHFTSDPIATSALFDAAGVVAVSQGLTTVTQTRDPAGSAVLLDGFNEPDPGAPDNSVPADPVPGIETSQCFDSGEPEPGTPRTGPRFACRFNVDRYVVETSAQQLDDAHQRAAAQYSMLTAK